MDENRDKVIPSDVPTEKEVAAAIDEATTTTERPLDKARDEKVIPVAQAVIEAIAGKSATVDINDKSEFTNLIVTIIKKTLEADLNVQMDNPYLFQLVLGVFGAFNQVVVTSKMAEIQDARYSAIAHEMLALLASANVPMGMDVKPEDQVKALETIRPQLEEIFAREMLTALELKYILQGTMQALQVTQQAFSGHIEDAVKKMEAKILQISDMTDLTMKKLDETLTTDIEELLKKSEEVK